MLVNKDDYYLFFSHLYLTFVTSLAGAVAKYCNEYVCVCMCLCLSVCLSVREDISGTIRAMFTKFLCMLPMVVARSSSSVVAIRYVLPVLWITSCSFLQGGPKK